MNAPDPEPPCTPPKSTGNGGAGRVDPDGQMESDDDDSDAQQVAKPRRKRNGKMEWTLMKRWVTGEKVEMVQEDNDRKLFELAREWMAVSKLQKPPGHVQRKPMLRFGSSFASTQSIRELDRLFQCPLSLIEAPVQMFGRNPHHGGRRLDAARSVRRAQCKQSG